MRLEFVRLLQRRTQFDVVINLAVDCEDNLPIVAHERLCPSVCTRAGLVARNRAKMRHRHSTSQTSRSPLTNTDDGKTLVREDGLLAAVTAGPVRAAVADFLGTGDELGALCGGVIDAVSDDDSAHG